MQDNATILATLQDISSQLATIRAILVVAAIVLGYLAARRVAGGLREIVANRAKRTINAMLERKEYGELRKYCEAKLELDATDKHTLWGLAVSCYFLGDFDTAKAMFHRFSALDPQSRQQFAEPYLAEIERRHGG